MVNLGGTAIGTGLTAPRDYIFRVVDKLREETGFGLARAENLVDATQNADAFVEVSGILKAHAVNLFKISSDLRLLASGPRTGLGELRSCRRVQAGSSIMPGKVNPVICEAVAQAAMLAIGNDAIVTMAAGVRPVGAQRVPAAAGARAVAKPVGARGGVHDFPHAVASRASRRTARPAPRTSSAPGRR